MRRFLVPAVALLAASAQQLPTFTSPFQGRWDLVLTNPDGTTSPRWMDFVEGRDPLIRVQPAGGSVHPAYDPIYVDGPHISFTMDKGNDKRPPTTWDLHIKNKQLTGTQKSGDQTATISGVKAPELRRDAPRQ